MMTKKSLLISFFLIVAYSCGSYTNSINFSVNEQREIVIKKLFDMKRQNPLLKVDGGVAVLKDGITNDNIYFYNNYFKIARNVSVFLSLM